MLNKMTVFVFASILSVLSLGNVEGRPIRKAPCLDSIAKVAQTVPLKVESESLLPTKEAKRCGGKHHRRTCDEPRTIRRVPVTITRSGKYCVTRDLTYSGSGAAIIVEADNVTINFANHSLFLTDPAAVGLLATDVEEFTLLNDKISLNQISNLETSFAINLVRVSKARIDNVFTENTLVGIRLEDSNDVTITNTHHKDHVGGNNTPEIPIGGLGIEIRTSSGVKVDNTYVEGSSGLNQFPNSAIDVRTSRDVILTNQKYENIDQAIFINRISSGILIDNLTANFNPSAFYSGLAIGAANDEDPINDVIIRNATFTNLDAFEGWDGINLGISTGIIFENIIIDTNTSIASDYTPAALHIGCFALNGCDGEGDEVTSSQGQFNNIVINNTNAYALLIESGEDLVFNNLEATGASVDNVYVGSAFGITIKDSYIGDSSGGDGIFVSENAFATTIFNNTIAGNDDGILVDANATNTVIDSNRVFSNTNGITNNSGTTQTVYNRVCGNTNNCNGAPGVFPSNTIGDPSQVGENICSCSPG